MSKHCHRLVLALLVSTFSAASLPASAQEYPTRSVRMLTSGAPGGLNDLISRIIAQALSDNLGQPVYVENKPGAMTMVGNIAASQATPDGYTLFLGASEVTSVPYLKKSAASFDALRDLTPIALVANSWGTFVSSPKFAAGTDLKTLLAYAKANPEQVKYGTNGVAGALHLTVELLQTYAGVKLLHVPYKGTANVVTDTASGTLDMAAMSISTAAQNQSNVRILAQAGPSRHPSLPNVPTTTELGLPDVKMDFWFGVMAPPKTPQNIVDKVAQAMEKVMQQPAVRDRLGSMGMEVSYMGPAKFASYIAEEKQRWAKLVPQWGINIDD